MARFRLGGHNLRRETGRHEELPWIERLCSRCKRKRLLADDFAAPIDVKIYYCSKIIFVLMREHQMHEVALCWPAHVKFERFDAV
jgi:hypothetical protein